MQELKEKEEEEEEEEEERVWEIYLLQEVRSEFCWGQEDAEH